MCDLFGDLAVLLADANILDWESDYNCDSVSGVKEYVIGTMKAYLLKHVLL